MSCLFSNMHTKCVFSLSVVSVGFKTYLFPILNPNFTSFSGALPISLLISRHMALVLSVDSITYLSFSRFLASLNTLYILFDNFLYRLDPPS